MKKFGRSLTGLIAVACVAGTAAADGITASTEFILTADDKTLPYVDYRTPILTAQSDKDVISWSMLIRKDRKSGSAQGTITVEIKSRIEFPRTFLAATLKSGEKLEIDRVNSTSESCPQTEECEVKQHLYLGISGEQLLATQDEPLVVAIGSEMPFKIEFSKWLTDQIKQSIAP